MSGRIGARALGVVALVGAALLAGCTSDEGIEVVVDDGSPDPTAVLGAAVSSVRAGSGRFREAVRYSFDGTDAGSVHYQSEGSFSGDDIDVSTTMSFSDDQENGELVLRERRVGGQAFSMMENAGGGAAGGDGLEGMWDGKWMQSAPEHDDEDPMMMGSSMALTWLDEDSSALLDSVTGLVEGAPTDLDGTTFRAVEGTVGMSALEALMSPDSSGTAPDDVREGMSPEEMARYDRLMAYQEEHSRFVLRALIAEDGTLRRLQVEGSSSADEEFLRCPWMLVGDVFLQIDILDLGQPVVIEAPDPATVQSWDDLSALGAGLGLAGDVLQEEVLAGASLIGLDPSTVASMTDVELIDALERIDDAAAALPTVDTVMGPMNRLELLEMVKVGMEGLGVDPTQADGLTDQQLADLINAYLEAPAEVPVDDHAEPEFLEEYDMFEGCPA